MDIIIWRVTADRAVSELETETDLAGDEGSSDEAAHDKNVNTGILVER